ncbi:hypothetical protein Barb4_02711 [Bacteroidales bacterium Barb4]|nr:hypothetical protein Barb4_02711 [Bacteroidales bacterium Barb4]
MIQIIFTMQSVTIYTYRSFRTPLSASSLNPTFRSAPCGAEISHSFGIGTTPNRV